MPIDPPHRRGRRDNGLDAAAFVPLADVDPRVGEHLLDVLQAAGVPAYLEPSVDIEPYTRTLAIPSPPTDRLWVDREQRVEARQIVEAEAEQAGQSAQTGPQRSGPPRSGQRSGPAGPPTDPPSAGMAADEEMIWAQIVAAYGTEAEPAVPPWPAQEDADEPPDAGSADSGTAAGEDTEAGGRHRPRRAGADPSGADGPDGDPISGAADGPDLPVADDEGHYEPPPPPPLPRLSRQAALGLTLIVLGAALLGAGSLIGLDSGARLLFGVVSLLSGAAVLVNRLRDSRSDDGPDDGAVV